MTLEIGTRLGHYRILALLGRGGMAEVYRAEDERLGREVALKVLPPEFAWDPERVERFEREVRAAARLAHPNIVTVYEFGQSDGHHFYTMALMPGGDLKDRIRDRPEGMAETEARSVAAAMARALDYAHGQGFVHRDVKPENILFWGDGTPQLTDFGIARAMGSGTSMTATGMSIGSPQYMSPEQARGLAVDGRSDLYSLGVVLYEMLTGRLPFDASDTLAVAYAHVNDPAPALPTELADWQPVVDRLLAKSPEDRYGSAGEVAEVLTSDAVGRPTATITDAPRPAPAIPQGREVVATRRGGESGTRLVEPPKPRRTMEGAVAGAVLALAVVGIAYLALRDISDPNQLTSNGGGGGAEARSVSERPAGVRSTPPSPPENPFDRARPEPVRREPVRPTPTLPESPRPEPTPSKQVRAQRPQPKPLPVIGGSGVLVVETTPAGAEVLVDGTPVGTTPLERSDIRAGVREVRLQHPHYETVRESGRRFRDGRVVRIQRPLVRGRGALTVTARPRETWVEVEGKRLAERTPVTLEDLPAGEVQVRLGAREHRPLAVRVEIPKGGLARLERKLEAIPYGSLTFSDPGDWLNHTGTTESRYEDGVLILGDTTRDYDELWSKETFGPGHRLEFDAKIPITREGYNRIGFRAPAQEGPKNFWFGTRWENPGQLEVEVREGSELRTNRFISDPVRGGNYITGRFVLHWRSDGTLLATYNGSVVFDDPTTTIGNAPMLVMFRTYELPMEISNFSLRVSSGGGAGNRAPELYGE